MAAIAWICMEVDMKARVWLIRMRRVWGTGLASAAGWGAGLGAGVGGGGLLYYLSHFHFRF